MEIVLCFVQVVPHATVNLLSILFFKFSFSRNITQETYSRNSLINLLILTPVQAVWQTTNNSRFTCIEFFAFFMNEVC
jgi:hypothetical protein